VDGNRGAIEGGSPPVMSYDEGIQPTQPGKSRKVAIGGVEHQSVLDGQGGQMGIRDEIGVDARCGQKLPEVCNVSRASKSVEFRPSRSAVRMSTWIMTGIYRRRPGQSLL
jgi:hypothetical protein